MKIGYFNQLQMPKPWRENAEPLLYKEAMEQAIRAEEVGFDSYWQTEHHFYPEIGHSSAPELFLAALAQHTSKIRLGFGCVILTCNHPYRVVEYVSTLDILSNGRVEFGTGRGSSVYQTDAFGVPDEESKALWEESLRVICSMFLNDPFPGFKGKYYDLPKRDIVPKPIQKPHPPLWVTATQPSTFAQAARMGLGCLAFTAIEPRDLIPAIQAYKEAAKECQPVGGYANHKAGGFAICNIDKNYTVGRDKACAAARFYFGDNDIPLQKIRFGTHQKGKDNAYYTNEESGQKGGILEFMLKRSNEDLIREGIVIGGDVDSVCRGIEKWMNVGFDQLLLMIQAGNTTHDEVMRAMDILGSKVLPKFQEAEPIPAVHTKASGS